MKFDPMSWNEVKKPNGKKTQVSPGRLRVRISAPSPLYLEVEGVEALVGVSTDFDVQISTTMNWHVTAPDGVRVFYYRQHSSSFACEGEVFTNIDKLPQESGSIAEVTRAGRLLELKHRQMRAEMMQIHRDNLAEIRAARATDTVVDPVADPAVVSEATE